MKKGWVMNTEVHKSNLCLMLSLYSLKLGFYSSGYMPVMLTQYSIIK